MQREFTECTEISQPAESSALGFEHSQAPGRIFNSLCNGPESEGQENTQDSAGAQCLYLGQVMISLSHALRIQGHNLRTGRELMETVINNNLTP